MCAFNEECGAPSPCFPIKGGGEPHFVREKLLLFLISTSSFPLLRHVFAFVGFIVAHVLASLWCLCSLSSWCSNAHAWWSTLDAHFFQHSSSSSSFAHALASSVFATRLTLPPPSHNIISSFFCPPYSLSELVFCSSLYHCNILIGS